MSIIIQVDGSGVALLLAGIAPSAGAHPTIRFLLGPWIWPSAGEVGLLTACGLSDQEKADYSSVQASGVSPAVYDKMMHGDDLSLYDIKALTRARASDGVILRYLRNRQTVYFLNTGDVEGLRKAGVSPSLIDYMLRTPGLYQPARTFG